MVNKLEIIHVAIEQLKQKNPDVIMTMIRQFVIENTPLPKAKAINLYDYADQGYNPRKILSGVYMDKGDKVAVATNCQVLIVSKSMYKPTKFKNGVVGKDGKNIPGEFVNYKRALPDDGDHIDIDVFSKDIIEQETVGALADKFLSGDNEFCASIPIHFGDNELQFPVSAVPLLLETKLDGWKLVSKRNYYYEDDDLKIVVSSVLVDK